MVAVEGLDKNRVIHHRYGWFEVPKDRSSVSFSVLADVRRHFPAGIFRVPLQNLSFDLIPSFFT